MDAWELSYITREEGIGEILKKGILSKDGVICLFEDLWFRYKDYPIQYMWKYLAKKSHLYGELAIIHIDEDFLRGKLNCLKQIKYKDPPDRYIWELKCDRIHPMFIESIDIVKNTLELTL